MNTVVLDSLYGISQTDLSGPIFGDAGESGLLIVRCSFLGVPRIRSIAYPVQNMVVSQN